MGSPGNDTELTVRVNTEIIHNALILRQSMLLDGCVFACEKSAIMSARAPPCRILKKAISKFKVRRKKLSTEMTTKKGERKIITVEVDDTYGEWLVSQPREIYHDAVVFEYRTSCTERKETRYVQSLDASIDNGFDIVDESIDVATDVLQKCDNERLYTAMSQLTEKQYLVLWLKAVEGLSFREIGTRLGLNKDTVVEHFNAAKKKIQNNFRKRPRQKSILEAIK